MKELKTYFEGLLDRTSIKVKNIDLIPDIIEQFLKENYDIHGNYTINKTKSRYIVDVKGTVRVKNKDILSLTNEYFEFGSVNREFDCAYCDSLTTLEGAPKEVGTNFYCNSCQSLKSLKCAPKKVGCNFNCSYCVKLTSLEGAPLKVGSTFYCSNCDSITTLEGAPKEVGNDFYCSFCKSLKSLKGAPEKIGGEFDCRNCYVKFKIEDVTRYTKMDIGNICT